MVNERKNDKERKEEKTRKVGKKGMIEEESW